MAEIPTLLRLASCASRLGLTKSTTQGVSSMSRNWQVTHKDHKPFSTTSLKRAFEKMAEWGIGSKIKEV